MSKTANKFAPEVRERAVRMALDREGEHASRWAAVSSIAGKIGCSAYTLLEWVKKGGGQRQAGRRADELADRLKALERENRELRRGRARRGGARSDQRVLPPRVPRHAR